jgi:hypothetical protein
MCRSTLCVLLVSDFFLKFLDCSQVKYEHSKARKRGSVWANNTDLVIASKKIYNSLKSLSYLYGLDTSV